ncbi:MAG TPA: pseudouridine synthase [Candidatus Scatomonas pullistercoris]|uniref:Pseudouridine synthase n=1 Tax=Candidatus Scatomonas pullistercoris TaxID=2840920 RepID=A0A9D1P484_9FIRM|nr:pseudouridine synthase [Candidatus Scatomonas pullistercoris]
MRINKYLSEAGLCSRREADRLIAAGRVTVGGITARTGMQVEDNSDIRIDGRRIGGQEKKVYLKFYKPRGIVCTADRREPGNLTDYLQYPVRVTYAGRLDKDSEGLLLLTNDGDLIDQAMRARNVHEKEYQVTVDREYEDTFLEKLQRGIYLKELRVRTRPCRAWRTGPKSFRIVLTQGLNRQIRRMCRSCGFRVITLRRVRILNLTLEGLKPGEYRELTEEELSELKTRVGGLQHG